MVVYTQYYRFPRDKSKVLHLIKYQIRKPRLDLAKWIMSQDDEGVAGWEALRGRYLEKATSRATIQSVFSTAEDFVWALWNYVNRAKTFGLWRYLSTFASVEEVKRCLICGEKVKEVIDIKAEDYEIFFAFSHKVLLVGKRGSVVELGYDAYPPWLVDCFSYDLQEVFINTFGKEKIKVEG